MSGYRGRRWSEKNKKNKKCIVSAHNVINWCYYNNKARKQYLRSPSCSDSYLNIIHDGDGNLYCDCNSSGCNYSLRVKDFCKDRERIECMVRLMLSSDGKRLKELIF